MAQIEILEIRFKREKKMAVRLVKQWNALFREIVSSPSLEILRTHLDKALSNPL